MQMVRTDRIQGRTDVAAMLSSYVRDDWYTAGDQGVTLVDASTGEAVARVSSAGINLAGMVGHARAVGGPGLRELTFHQRAAALKRLAVFLRERRDGLYEQSARTGATLDDARVDVDGGIGALFTYASKGRRELPNDVLYVDGPPEPLGGPGWPCSSTPSTSRSGGCWRSWPRPSSPASRRSSSRPARPPM
jgi:oxepin-CoA hydrolase/3-oxo-5,6-dehydrosuberyl-CoA semialdehyde dehydrogenase